MRVAIIDLGTNTFNLLIVEVNNDKTYSTLLQSKIAVKLGEGGINKGYIAENPFERGIEAIKTYNQTSREYNVERTFAVATSAIRGASNGAEFVQRAKQETGIEIAIISGDKEAEIIYHGVRKAVKMDNTAYSLIIDIGGGSTEFVIANGKEIIWKQSFLLGVARLIELFNPSDPIQKDEIEQYNNYLHAELRPLFEAVKKYPVTELIGSSGSFDSIAEMLTHKYYTPRILDGKTEFTFDLEQCRQLHETIVKSTTAERTQMKGLIAMRVDMIVVSSLLVHFIINAFDITKMRLSTYSLKEGLLDNVLHSLEKVG